ncbi:MAG TPA: ATP-binding protein [Nevskiaceae bacterium]|nr:ATP-binding protein [Nevskiaceae bacterium]
MQWRFAGWTWLIWPMLFALALAAVSGVIVEFRAQDQARSDGARDLVPLIAQAAAPSLATNDKEALGRLVRLVLRLHPQVGELEIRGALGDQLAYGRSGGKAATGLLPDALSLLEEKTDLRMTLEAVPRPIDEIRPPAPPSVHLVLRPTSTDPRVLARLRRFLNYALGGLGIGLLMATIGIGRLARWQATLRDAARNLALGRLESRAPASAVGVTGELSESINSIGKQLLEAQDRYRGWMEQETGRLRRELSDERAKLRQLERSVEETETASRVKGELYAQISHELRTPLAAIIGYSDLLTRASLPGPIAEQVQTLSKSAHGLLAMVNDLLDWSRIEAGRLQLNDAPFDLEDCVEDVIAMLAPLAYDKNLELVHIIYHDVPRQLIGDAQRIRQLLTNLLSNAIKFTERGEVVLRVLKEREEPRQLTVLFRVTDTGVGLSPDQQRQLFQPYRQLGTKPGSGLGLVITRKLAELMGGNVTVESAQGQGATFSANLLLGRQPEPPQAQAFDRLRNSRVWVCEPHTTARLALLHSFEYWGMDVRELGSIAELREAAGRAGASRPDVVVVGMSRAEAEQELQPVGDPVLPALQRMGVPALCLIASVSQSLHEAMKAKGATRALPKSVGRVALYQAISELISGQAVPETQLGGRTVLIADNNVANRRYIVALLQGLGAKTIEADDGREAVERWKEARPDAVLMDIRMPELDGLGAAREIRALENETDDKRTLIIGISAFFEQDERRKLALAGMDGDLLKPFDERQVLRMFARRAVAPPPAESKVVPTKAAPDRLAQDAEMRALLREELPLQLRELEDAFAAGEMQRLRDAGHQIHGTAAFYRLAPLKQAAAALEGRVAHARSVEAEPRIRDDLSAVREAVMAMLDQMQDA